MKDPEFIRFTASRGMARAEMDRRFGREVVAAALECRPYPTPDPTPRLEFGLMADDPRNRCLSHVQAAKNFRREYDALGLSMAQSKLVVFLALNGPQEIGAVARHLGSKPSTVMVMASRARKKLAQHGFDIETTGAVYTLTDAQRVWDVLSEAFPWSDHPMAGECLSAAPAPAQSVWSDIMAAASTS